MSESQTVNINLDDNSYDIHIGQEMLRSIADYVPFDMAGRHLFILTDENVSVPHGGAIYEALKSCKAKSVQFLALPAGETTKSTESLQRVIGWMLDHNVNRESVLFTVGGGVVGDLGGFAAAITMRGIPFVQVPTTLLAQVDSSVGGKTAIDVPQGKNLVGAFYQPKSVICDLSALSTLPRREMLAGYAETVKYGLINDLEFFEWLETNGADVCDGNVEALVRAVQTACVKKAAIVEEDEKEQGVRALLNLGHTFGHALEVAAGYDGRLLHGEAIAIGMVMAFRLSVMKGLCDSAEADRVESHLADIGLPTKVSMIFPPLAKGLESDVDTLLAAMRKDKKVTTSGLNFILCKGIGQAFICDDVDMSDVKTIIENSIEGK